MIHQQHLKLLQQGVATWNKWKCQHPYWKVDLRETDLTGIDLTGVDLSGAILSGRNLRGGKLHRS